MCDECTWHHNTFLVQSVYWHLAIKLYCIVKRFSLTQLKLTALYNFMKRKEEKKKRKIRKIWASKINYVSIF